jgi:hypothetical protein
MALWGQKSRLAARETLLACLVLALAFLNFGHSNLSFAFDGHTVVASASPLCGDPVHHPGEQDHQQPCHACRIGGGADLPPPSCAAVPVAFGVLPVAYADTPALLPPPRLGLTAHPRGPPAI